MDNPQPFDSIAAASVVAELNRSIVGARIDKIQQPSPFVLVLLLRGKGTKRILFSARGPFSRVHPTTRKVTPPARAPAFCMFLRKYIEGGKIVAVRQLGLERAIAFDIRTTDEMGDSVGRTLLAELTGSHSNFLLLDEGGVIMTALRHVGETMSRVRQILPGLKYEPPPIDPRKADPRAFDPAAVVLAGALDKALLGQVHSLSRAAIGRICASAGLDPGKKAEDLSHEEGKGLSRAWRDQMAALAEGQFEPRLAGEVLDAYYGDWEDRQEREVLRAHLARAVQERVTRLLARIEQGEGILGSADEADRYRLYGDLLLTWAHQVRLGEIEAVLQDPATGDPVDVPLDPQRSPVENAQMHYRAYKKALSARRVQERLVAEARSELADWRLIAEEVALADEIDHLKLVAIHFGTDDAGRPRPLTEGLPDRFRSTDGLEILVGKNNRQNDMVTTRLSKPEDWWFHAQKAPGSHVVVRASASGAALPTRTCQEAALLAAWYSKARQDTRVAVAYTLRKHVRKPNGARPGFVIYDHERILVVQPDAEAVEAITRLSTNEVSR